MKIDSIRNNSIINAYKQQKSYEKEKITKNKPKDKVEISDAAKYLNKTTKNNENINIDKINKIKNRIEQGTYNVDSRSLAKKIIKITKGE